MYKSVIGLMVVASFAFADEMPDGSKQYQAFYDLSNEIGFPADCPPELQIDGIQSGCAIYQGSADDFANAVRRAIEARDIELRAVERVWSYDEDFKRYGRNYTLSGDDEFRVIYGANDGRVPNVTMFYTP